MCLRRYLGLAGLLSFSLASVLPMASAQDHSRGRKYKAPPDTSHIEVEIVRASNGKPIPNAAVIFNPEKDGKDEGNLEVKTGPDGKAAIDVIPTGSKLRVQVIAGGFATFAEDYMIDTTTKEISIKMLRPRAQVSAYVDNSGKASERKPGVQEPVRPPTTPPPASVTPPATPDAESKTPPAPETKPNL
ncbi:carboxypeptidase-like regulatory domain-containing protein [Granulicella aggregans]|jgi:hypothetical protein|uniref:carboxypeptidase-like regulatory domain-containing protein n=1 Tax=Granulicella aggregans TaxID=474949 RepID=UPI0021DF66C5|nr:carboxypeptidase-like regulatory domain-containing protein [Granulicella aggregans]